MKNKLCYTHEKAVKDKGCLACAAFTRGYHEGIHITESQIRSIFRNLAKEDYDELEEWLNKRAGN